MRDRERAEIILLRAEGQTQGQIAARVGVSRATVNDWCPRFLAQRPSGLDDAPGRGRKPWLPLEAVRMMLEKAATLARLSCRTMAGEAGISQAGVERLWAANDIEPHLWRTFKLSQDKQFEAKFWDVIGLYLDPPDKALVLCCDEKSQCEALERTQPGLPLGVGHIRTRTHDYFQHGTLTLFTALNYLDGKLISRIARRHRHQEWLAFLKTIDQHHRKHDGHDPARLPHVKRWQDASLALRWVSAAMLDATKGFRRRKPDSNSRHCTQNWRLTTPLNRFALAGWFRLQFDLDGGDLAQNILALGLPDITPGVGVALSWKADDGLGELAQRGKTLLGDDHG